MTCSDQMALYDLQIIKRDIYRTYPELEFFADGGKGQQSLLHVIKAYSLHDPDVGYCQGTAFIVGQLLLLVCLLYIRLTNIQYPDARGRGILSVVSHNGGLSHARSVQTGHDRTGSVHVPIGVHRTGSTARVV